MEKAHHLYGGSTAKYWSNCHGWASLQSTLPKEEEAGEAAIKGTALHTGILERKFFSEIQHRLHGTPVNVTYDDIPFWPEDGEELAENFWQDVWVHALEEIVTGKQIYIERKLMLFPELDAGGTADVVILYTNDKSQVVCVVGDLKTGYHEVLPSDVQLLFYICAAQKIAKEKGLRIDVFKSFVWQPTKHPAYSEHVFSASKVESTIRKFERAIALSKEKPKFKVGDYCKFCKAQSLCPAYHKHLNGHMDIEIRQELPAVATLSDDILVRLFKASDKIETYISNLRKHIINRFVTGTPVEGLKVVAGVSKRRWKNEQIAQDLLFNTGIDATQPKIIGIGEAEKRLKNSGKTKEEISSIIYTLTEKGPAPPKLTTTDDPRPAVDVSGCQLLTD